MVGTVALAPEAGYAVRGRGSGDSVADGALHAVAGDLSARGVGSAMEVEEAVTGGGNGGAPATGKVLEVQEIAEAGKNSIGASDLAMDAKEVPGVGGDDEKLGKFSVRKENLPEGKDLSRQHVGSETKAQLNAGTGNASASQEVAAMVKSEGAESLRTVNLSMEASGAAMEVRGESLQDDLVVLGDKHDSSVQAAYASQQGEQLKSSDHSAGNNNSGAAPVNQNKQDPNLIEEAVTSKTDSTRSNTIHCDVYDGSWVFDETYPLYTSDSCPFIDEGFSCGANGRMDQRHMKWRWQPKHCNIPRYLLRSCNSLVLWLLSSFAIC